MCPASPLGNDDAGIYATALALISQVDASNVAQTAAEVIAAIAADLVDGVLSQETIDAFNQAALDITSSPIGGEFKRRCFDAGFWRHKQRS